LLKGKLRLRGCNRKTPVLAGTSGIKLASRDAPGPCPCETGKQGQRIALNQAQACEAARQVHG